jgi:hypothetical protein
MVGKRFFLQSFTFQNISIGLLTNEAEFRHYQAELGSEQKPSGA